MLGLRSKLRPELLTYYFTNPDASLYLRGVLKQIPRTCLANWPRWSAGSGGKSTIP